MIRHSHRCHRTVGVIAHQCNMFAFAHDFETKSFQGLDDPVFRCINRELRHYVASCVSAINASKTGESSSNASEPNVSIWTFIADSTSASAWSYVSPWATV